MQRAVWFAKLLGIGCAIAIMLFITLTFLNQLGDFYMQ